MADDPVGGGCYYRLWNNLGRSAGDAYETQGHKYIDEQNTHGLLS